MMTQPEVKWHTQKSWCLKGVRKMFLQYENIFNFMSADFFQ